MEDVWVVKEAHANGGDVGEQGRDMVSAEGAYKVLTVGMDLSVNGMHQGQGGVLLRERLEQSAGDVRVVPRA